MHDISFVRISDSFIPVTKLKHLNLNLSFYLEDTLH